MTEEETEAERARVSAHHAYLEVCRAETSIATLRALVAKRGAHPAFIAYVDDLGIAKRINALLGEAS